MKRYVTNERGFTLVEMMIVLSVITILMLIIVPNITQNSNVASDKSCEATIKLVQSQVAVYIADNNGQEPDSIDDLIPYLDGYSENDDITCPDDTRLILKNGEVVIE